VEGSGNVLLRVNPAFAWMKFRGGGDTDLQVKTGRDLSQVPLNASQVLSPNNFYLSL
jgi:hypothetical protein